MPMLTPAKQSETRAKKRVLCGCPCQAKPVRGIPQLHAQEHFLPEQSLLHKDWEGYASTRTSASDLWAREQGISDKSLTSARPHPSLTDVYTVPCNQKKVGCSKQNENDLEHVGLHFVPRRLKRFPLCCQVANGHHTLLLQTSQPPQTRHQILLWHGVDSLWLLAVAKPLDLHAETLWITLSSDAKSCANASGSTISRLTSWQWRSHGSYKSGLS